jgi:hypothetical protein
LGAFVGTLQKSSTTVNMSIQLASLVENVHDTDFVADTLEAVHGLPDSETVCQRGTLRARWIPGPAMKACYSVGISDPVELIENLEPFGCRLELQVGGVVTNQRLLVAACQYQEVRVVMYVDGAEEFGFDAQVTKLTPYVRQIALRGIGTP